MFKIEKGISIVVVVALTWLSCTKEQMPSGLNLVDTVETKDTTYITTSIPAADTKKILMEEPTGVRCPNCPDGATVLAGLKTTYPNKIISASVYSKFLNQFTAPAKYDFNSQDAVDLVTFLGGDPSKPTASIDRTPTGYVGGAPYFFNKADWSSKVLAVKNNTTPLNIELNVLPNGSDYYLKSKVTFTEATTADLAMSVYLIEDSVVDVQEFPSSVIDTNYVHNHILRKIITPISGSSFLNDVATKEKGRVFERTFGITVSSNVLNKAHCKLICFVHKTGASKEVIHVEEIDL